MRISHLFGITLREAPTGAETASHQLLLRAGFIRPLCAGIFSVLPLARRAMSRIERIMREEINAIGGQEMTMPVVQPAEIWKETGRWYQVGSEMGRFKDKNAHDMVLAMTHEEAVADLVRSEIRSYRQMPALIYHIQTKWRDDPRPRAGLLRVREFTMLDSYSLDRNYEGLDQQYQAHYEAYHRIFERCGLPVKAIQSDTGMMGGKQAHEFMYFTPIGEDSILSCPACGYTANQQVARFKKQAYSTEEPLSLEKIATPETATIEDLATLLKIPKEKTAKAVFLMAKIPIPDSHEELSEKFIFAVVRGDMEVNEIKLGNALKAIELRPATEEEILAIGAAPGYASPLGLKDVLVIVDDLIPQSPNLVAGANETGYHLKNVNYGRDYQAQIVADIVSAQEGSPCPECEQAMTLKRGVEVGHIFKLGTRYSEALGCTFLDEDGSSKPVIMGSYGIGVGRLLACIAEEHHDEHGLIWPRSVSSYPLHLVALSAKSTEVAEKAEALYEQLCKSGIEPLYDDRAESPGVKFADADLIGLPLRLTISERSLKAGGVELKLRGQNETRIKSLETLLPTLKNELQEG